MISLLGREINRALMYLRDFMGIKSVIIFTGW